MEACFACSENEALLSVCLSLPLYSAHPPANPLLATPWLFVLPGQR